MFQPSTERQPDQRSARTYWLAAADLHAWDARQAEIGPPRTLIIDAPDVLYDDTYWRRWLVRLIGRLDMRVPYESFFRDWDGRFLPAVCCGHRELHEALAAFLLGQGLSWAQIDEIEAASRAQQAELTARRRPLAGVLPTVQRLRNAGVCLAAWIDSPESADSNLAMFQRMGLSGQFELLLSSMELEMAQPSLHCYAAVLGQLSVDADQAIFVSHDAAHLAGARSFGLRTVAVNHEKPTTADLVLNSFDELASIVDVERQPSLCLQHHSLSRPRALAVSGA